MKQTLILSTLFSALLLHASTVSAAVNSLYGGVSLGANYDSNANRTSDNEVDEWETTVSAFIKFTRESQKGALSFGYAPTIKYNERLDDTTLDHRLNIYAYRYLSEQLRFNISDVFVKTDDLWGQYLSSPATGLDTGRNDVPDFTPGDDTSQFDSTLSDRLGREKFWQNYFSTNIAYEYTKNSNATLGYNNRILEYDEPDMDNYKYNEPWINLSYWFNPQWNSSISYTYTDAQFDISEDSTSHDVGFTLNHVLSVQDTVFGGLRYFEKNYDTPAAGSPADQDDYYLIRANLGWTHAFSPQKSLSMTAGPTYVDMDNDDSSTTGFFDVNYMNNFENGSWFIRADGGYEDRSFDAVNQGLSEYQRLSGGISWLLAKDLSANLGAYIRRDSYQEAPSNGDEKEFNATAGLRYSFARWYYVSGRYIYNQLNADINSNDYVDHRFFITLGFSKELNRW